MSSVTVTVAAPSTLSAAWKKRMRAAALAAVDALPKKVRAQLREGTSYTLSLAVVTDARMRALNAKYRKKDKTTDVLSFSRLEGEPFPAPEAEIGDVLVSLTVAKRQAKEYGATVPEELERLVVHGVLHLFGYDHEISEKEARRQFRLQNAVLAKLHGKRVSRKSRSA